MSSSTYDAYSWDIVLLFSENVAILASVVLPQYTRVKEDRQMTDTQTTYHDNSGNKIASFG